MTGQYMFLLLFNDRCSTSLSPTTLTSGRLLVFKPNNAAAAAAASPIIYTHKTIFDKKKKKTFCLVIIIEIQHLKKNSKT